MPFILELNMTVFIIRCKINLFVHIVTYYNNITKIRIFAWSITLLLIFLSCWSCI